MNWSNIFSNNGAATMPSLKAILAWRQIILVGHYIQTIIDRLRQNYTVNWRKLAGELANSTAISDSSRINILPGLLKKKSRKVHSTISKLGFLP